MTTSLKSKVDDLAAKTDQLSSVQLAEIASSFRQLQGSNFKNWMECSRLLKQAREHFVVDKRPMKEYRAWAKDELGLTSMQADRLPLIHSEFGHYSVDLYPYIDVNVLLHLVTRRHTGDSKSRLKRLRQLYTRRINANGGTRVSYETFRHEIYKDKGGTYGGTVYTIEVEGLKIRIEDPASTLKAATVRRRLKKALNDGVKLEVVKQPKK